MNFVGNPQDPLRGINSTAVSIFSFCINKYIANRSDLPAWTFGVQKGGFTKRVTSY